MRLISSFFIVVLLFVCASCCKSSNIEINKPNHQSQINEETLKQLSSKSVVLTTKGDGEIVAICSGIFISDNLILTARHCVTGMLDMEEPIGIAFPGEVSDDGTAKYWHELSIVKRDKHSDLALLKLEEYYSTPAHGYASVSFEPIETGDTVYAYGCPMGYCYTPSQGIYLRTREVSVFAEDDVVKVVQAEISIGPGSSGGALFTDNFEILGICSFGYPRYQGSGFFISREEILKFLYSN